MNGIHVELASPCDTDDFVGFLAGRGLAATVTSSNDHCELEVEYAVDPELHLRQEFEDALAAWLEQHERPLVPIAGRGHGYVLRPPAG